MSNKTIYRILVIDDNPAIHEDFRKILTADDSAAAEVGKAVAAIFSESAPTNEFPPFEVDCVLQGLEGVNRVAEACGCGRPYALAFVDIRMPPGWDGIETIKHLWEKDPALQVVICTAFSDYSTREIARQLGRTDRLLLLKKPFDNLEVRQLALSLTEKWNLARQIQSHLLGLETLVQQRTNDLERSLSLIKATLDATADGILVVDKRGRAVNFNQTLLRIWNLPLSRLEGCEEEQFLASVLRQLKDPEPFLKAIRQTLDQSQAEHSGSFEFKDGRIFEHYSHPQYLGGQIIGRVWSFRDVTQRSKAEEKVRLLAHTMESIKEMATITDLQGNITFVNKACLEKFGYEKQELIGRHFSIFYSPGAAAHLQSDIPIQTRAGGWKGEVLNQTKDGQEFFVSLSTSNIRDEAGNIIGLVGIAEDITERKSAEEVLRTSENQYRLLFENNPSPVFVYDQAALVFLAVNDAAVRVYGYSKEEFRGFTLRDIALPEEVPAFIEKLSRLNAESSHCGIWRHRKKDGKLAEMEITSHALELPGKKAWLSLAMDVTERLNLEAQLRQSQKMESVGQLAGGIAHDFNNLLTVINGHTGILLASDQADAQTAERLREISEATQRAADLTRQLLTFSRKQVLHPQIVDFNEVIHNIAKMLRRVLGEDILLETNFSPSLPAIKADLGMMEQVLLNLAVNSRDAMPRGGKLLIETCSVIIDADYVQHHPEAATGRFVRLTFSDTGCGIPPENLSRIFEPFFTTKELDRGTGLGLATVYGIIKQHEGWIEVDSRVNEGTTFRVFLPGSNEKSYGATLPSGEQRVIGGTETILVVEDEAPLLKLIRHILENYGYKVLECRNGVAALEIWEQHRNKIDLLLADLILPDGMSGPELAEILRRSKPTLKVVYSSGYNTERLKEFALGPGANFIQKPFHARKLAEIVYDCLNNAT